MAQKTDKSPLATADQKAELRIGDQSWEFPIVIGTEGERAIDITKLRAKTGHITLDPGYANSGSCQSAITFIDGEEGILHYRGIPIEVLAEKSSFMEVTYLLTYGKLPTRSELEKCESAIRRHTMLHEDLKLRDFLKKRRGFSPCNGSMRRGSTASATPRRTA